MRTRSLRIIAGFVVAFMISLSGIACTDSAPMKMELETVASAIANYRKTYGIYPPICVLDQHGKPAHSWRVLVLPFVSANSFTQDYNFAMRWDSKENLRLLIPETTGQGERDLKDSAFAGDVYTQSLDPSQVFTRVFVVANQHVKRFDFAKGHSVLAGIGREAYGFENGPILVVGTTSSKVHWMKPTDLSIAQKIVPDSVLLHDQTEKIVGSIEIGADSVYRNRDETLQRLKQWAKE